MQSRHEDDGGHTSDGETAGRTDLPTTRRRALQAGVVGLGSVVGLGGRTMAAEEACEVTQADLLATRDAWADPALVEQAVADQAEMLAALDSAGYLQSTADAVAVTARRLECEAVPEIFVLRRPGEHFLTASIRPESGSAFAIVAPPDGPGGGGGGGDDDLWYYTEGEKGCHPPCWQYGICCTCEEELVDGWDDWDFMTCTDYRCWYYSYDCHCDCSEYFCWPDCLVKVEPVVVEMPGDWWPPTY